MSARDELTYAGHTWSSAREWCLWVMQHNAAPGPAQNGQRAALDAYRAEVLREGADAAEQEFIYGTTPAASERDEIWDDAVRAVATMLRGLADEDGEKTTAAAAAVTPQPDHGKALAEADAGRVGMTPRHIGRHWHGHDIEDACPCPKAPCGLVVEGTAVPECTQHPATRGQTIRQSHLAAACPAAEQPLTGRQSKLLAAIEADPGRWGTTRAERLYRVWGVQHARRSARRDLAQLCDLGHLYRVGPDHAIRYQLNARQGGELA